MFKIAVAGTGYVGLVAGVCFAEKGNDVYCVDINNEKIELMKKGISPIYEPGLNELMLKNNAEGRMNYTTDYKNAYKNAEFIFIGVGTPEKNDGTANLDYVFTVARQIAETVENDCIVVVKSTVPIGTNDIIEEMIKANLAHKVNINVVSNPEFLAQGRAITDTLEPSRIVIGTENKVAEERMKKLYSNFDAPMVCTNRRSAEMIKYASNDFLALKISYINDIANACELVGANIEDVSLGMSFDKRIGDKFLHAGCGYGGSCFPKDTKALYNQLLSNYDYEMKTIKAAIDVNENQKMVLYKKLKRTYPSIEGLTIAVLGLTFKAGTDDLREAPAMDVIPHLLKDNAIVRVYDPVGINNCKKVFLDKVIYAESVQSALNDADACLIFTEWSEIKNISFDEYKALMKNPVIFDGRNLYDPKAIQGVLYFSIGRR